MRKRGVIFVFVFLVVFVLSFFTIYASSDSLETFSKDIKEIVSPPGPPEEKSEEFSKLTFTLRDYNTKLIVGDIHAGLVIENKNTGKKTNSLKYVSKEGIFELLLEPSQYVITFKVDIIDTSGTDYFFKSDFDATMDIQKEIYLLPIGSLIGIVYDKKGNVVRNAEVNFKSNKDYCAVDELRTDNSGIFSVDLPVGKCKISATNGNCVGYADVNIEQGTLNEVDIKLNKTISSSNWIYFIFLIFAFLLTLYFVNKSQKKSKRILNKKQANKDKKKGSRINDIFNTLNENEKSIVNFLMENENKSSQSKLKYGVNIPKTTLSRLLEKLELKNIIKIERIGKLKKIELTDWFLGKKWIGH